MFARYAQGLEAQRQRLDEGRAAPDDGPVHPGILRPAAGQVMLLGVDVAIRLAHGDGPVVAPAHHDALDEGLPTDMRPRPDVRIGLECLA